MDPLERVKLLLVPGGDEEVVVHECRDCGTDVPSDVSTCPNCDSTNVARYEL